MSVVERYFRFERTVDMDELSYILLAVAKKTHSEWRPQKDYIPKTDLQGRIIRGRKIRLDITVKHTETGSIDSDKNCFDRLELRESPGWTDYEPSGTDRIIIGSYTNAVAKALLGYQGIKIEEERR